MNAKRMMVAWALAAFLLGAHQAPAQLFGERSLGRASPPRGRESQASRRSFSSGLFERSSAGKSAGSNSPFAGVGMPDESARYMRGNRSARDFVGANSGNVQNFVGVQQTEDPSAIRSAIDEVAVQTGPDANRTGRAAARTRTRMYQPRLRVGFDFARPASPQLSSRLTNRLESTLTSVGTASVEVSVEEETAILRGEVGSAREKKLARLLLLLEPGISNVRDELTVKGAPKKSPPKKAPETPPATRPTPSTAPPATQP